MNSFAFSKVIRAGTLLAVNLLFHYFAGTAVCLPLVKTL